MGDSLPVATVHGGAARRLWSFVAAPPRDPTAGTHAWVLSLAGASYVLHAGYFTLVILVGDDSLGVALGAVAGMLLGLMVFMTTITAMAIAQVAGRWVIAAGLGALWGGWLADAHRHDLREPSGSSRT